MITTDSLLPDRESIAHQLDGLIAEAYGRVDILIPELGSDLVVLPLPSARLVLDCAALRPLRTAVGDIVAATPATKKRAAIAAATALQLSTHLPPQGDDSQ